jgi:hypothetical protein
MVDITFLEIHVEDASFTATKESEGADAVEFEAADEVEEPGGGPGLGALFAVLVGLVFLVAVGYVAKRRFVDDEDEEGYGAEDFDGYDD